LTSGTAHLTLSGDLDDTASIALRLELKKISAARPKDVVLQLSGLRGISGRCARALAFAEQGLDHATTTTIIGASQQVKDALSAMDMLSQCTVLGADPAEASPHS
jgi:anti-anti-sigma regulatory factor